MRPALAAAALLLGSLAAGAGGGGVAGPTGAGAEAGAAQRAAPPFGGTSKPIRGKVRERVVGSSWRRGCPVGLRKLRVLRIRHWGFDGRPRRGRLIVHRGHDRELLRVFRRLYRKRFPIRRVELIDRYDADDRRSMAADNSSGFNCRFVAGTSRWSMHAYGKAVDLNPVENPYVSGSHVSPPAGRPYADRSRRAKGMIHAGDVVVRAFARIGWEWGGAWRGGTRDYHHFSANGR